MVTEKNVNKQSNNGFLVIAEECLESVCCPTTPNVAKGMGVKRNMPQPNIR